MNATPTGAPRVPMTSPDFTAEQLNAQELALAEFEAPEADPAEADPAEATPEIRGLFAAKIKHGGEFGLWGPSRFMPTFRGALDEIEDNPFPAIIENVNTGEIIYANEAALEIGIVTVCPFHGATCERRS